MKSFKREIINMKSAQAQNKPKRTKFTSFFTKEYFLTYENFNYSNSQNSSRDNNKFNYFILLLLIILIAIGYDYISVQCNSMFGLSSFDLIIDSLPMDNSYYKPYDHLLMKKAQSLKNLRIFTFLGLN